MGKGKEAPVLSNIDHSPGLETDKKYLNAIMYLFTAILGIFTLNLLKFCIFFYFDFSFLWFPSKEVKNQNENKLKKRKKVR